MHSSIGIEKFYGIITVVCMSKPVVSICLPTLNARQYLAPRMNSILSQTLTDWELIVCDSCSDDGTWEYLQKFKDDPRVRLHQVPKEGMYAGWNECLKRCRGEHVYIATADDTMREDCLDRMVGTLEKAASRSSFSAFGRIRVSADGTLKADIGHKKVQVKEVDSISTCEEIRIQNTERPLDLCVCNFDFIDEHGRVVDPPPRGTAREFYGEWLKKTHIRPGDLEYLLHSFVDISWTTMTSVLFRRRLLDNVGLFREDCGPYADRFWAQRVALFSDTVYLPQKMATWRCHEFQQSSQRNSHRKLQSKLLQIAEQELEHFKGSIPGDWKGHKLWTDVLLWGARHRYFSSFGLNRRLIRAHPLSFCANSGKALIHEPAFFFRRLLSGFDWDDDILIEPLDCLRHFIELYNVPAPMLLEI
jgi:glycosyltransferase involved in cell wall biosynthesis